jgi:apolipoprotein D and lipocalin family protein
MKRTYKLSIILAMILSTILGCGSDAELATKADFDLNKYLGTWYEIARFPHSFEKGLSCVSAEYSLREDGKINVKNKGFQTNKEKWTSIDGVARVPDISKPGEIKVQFFWPFSGDYFVIDVDEEYHYALVGSPSRKYLWILSREVQLNEITIQQITAAAEEAGFEVSKLERVEHNCPLKIL